MTRRTLTEVNNLLCELITEAKQSYFDPDGKPGAYWNPLKAETIRRKANNKFNFNMDTGFLKNSIYTVAEINGGDVAFKCRAVHQNGDAALDTLMFKYGRNFLDFDEDEMMIIGEMIIKLLFSLEEN